MTAMTPSFKQGDRVRVVQPGKYFNQLGVVIQVHTGRLVAYYLVRLDPCGRGADAERFPEYDLTTTRRPA